MVAGLGGVAPLHDVLAVVQACQHAADTCTEDGGTKALVGDHPCLEVKVVAFEIVINSDDLVLTLDFVHQ